MPVSSEQFSILRSEILLATWNVSKVYQDICRDFGTSLTREQRVELKKTYDAREAHRVEIMAHRLPYALAPKDTPEQNIIRNSIAKIEFMENKYEFYFMPIRNNGAITRWDEENKTNPYVVVLIIQDSPSDYKMRVIQDGILLEFCLKPEPKGATSGTVYNIIDYIASHRDEEEPVVSLDIVKLTTTDAAKFLLAETYSAHNLYLPFHYRARSNTGEYFHVYQQSTWIRMERPGQQDSIYSSSIVRRFVHKDSLSDLPPSATLDWVNPRLVCFVLVPEILAKDTHQDLQTVNILWTGTHNLETGKADFESSAGFISFGQHRKEFLQFIAPLIKEASRNCLQPLTIANIGHSLGGALAQLSCLELMKLYDKSPFYQKCIGQISLEIKNATGVPLVVTNEHAALVNKNKALRCRALFSLVEGDIVQRTGASTLFQSEDIMSLRNVEIVFCKVNSPAQLISGKTKIGAAVVVATQVGAIATFLLAPPTTLAAIGCFGLSTCGTSMFFMALGTKGAIDFHSRKFFSECLSDCTLELRDPTIADDRAYIARHLSDKSAPLVTGVEMLNKVTSTRTAGAELTFDVGPLFLENGLECDSMPTCQGWFSFDLFRRSAQPSCSVTPLAENTKDCSK